MAGQTKPLTKWRTLKGEASSQVLQPNDEWIDLAEYEELAVLLEVAFLYATTPSAISVIVESAQNPDSPVANWQEIVSMTATGSSLAYASAKASATTHFLRFLRWRVAAGVTGSDWTATFKVDATVR